MCLPRVSSPASIHRKFGGDTLTEVFLEQTLRNRPLVFDLSFMKRRGLVSSEVHQLVQRELARDVKEVCFKVAGSRQPSQ